MAGDSEKRVAKREMPEPDELGAPYLAIFGDVSKIIDAARESAARTVNAAITAAYWLIGHRIVEFEQSGGERAEYGAALSATRKMLLTCIIARGENLSTSEPPRSMKKTVGTPLTATTAPTARGSPVTSKTSQGNVIKSN